LRNYTTEASFDLIDSCRTKKTEKNLKSLSDIQKVIAAYPIENIKLAKIDEPPKDFTELCIRLAKTGIAIAEVNGIIVNSEIEGLVMSASKHLEQNNLSAASDKIFDAIDRLRIIGVPIA